MKRFASLMTAAALVVGLSACGSAANSPADQQSAPQATEQAATQTHEQALDEAVDSGWAKDSKPLASLMSFVEASVDEASEGYIPPEDRIAVFDMDGTLLGERFPTYFNDWLYIQRALYDDSYEAPAELRDFAQRWEDKVLRGVAMDDFDALERQLGPKLYEGLTIDEYTDVVRDFKAKEVWGFEGMTYGEAFFKPMVFVVKYLYDNGYQIYVNSGTYRDAVRTMMEGTLDSYIPAGNVIGTDLVYESTDEDDEEGFEYSMQPDEDLEVVGELFVKNLNTNKVLAMQREIGKHPVLAFGNSGGDFSMANYALQNPDYESRGYMLLCDNTELDYGDPEVAASFAQKCADAGFTTISMRDDFTTIYGEQVHKVDATAEELDEAA